MIIRLGGVVFVVLLVLKLCELAEITWFWVFFPLWIIFPITLLLSVVSVMIDGVIKHYESR